MSGGLAYVLDVDGEFAKRCNGAMVDLEPVSDSEDESALKRLIENHQRYTGSKRAARNPRGLGAAPRQVRQGLPEGIPPRPGRARAEEGRGVMGKITGFLEHERLEEPHEPTEARKKHYREFYARLSDADAGVQGARCMDCGIPFCMSGCPVNNIIPDWNDLVYRQDWKTAIDTLH